MPRVVSVKLAFIILILSVIISTHYESISNRAYFLWTGIHYQFNCDDLTPKIPPPPLSIADEILMNNDNNNNGDKKKVVPVIFIRHGQSVWNTMANASSVMNFLQSTSSSIANEIKTIFSTPNLLDSSFLDAKLTEPAGVREALDLAKVWNSNPQKFISSNNNNDDSFILVTSNLRRAIDTTRIVFNNILEKKQKKFIIDSSLQEGCCHVDVSSFQDLKSKLRENVAHFNSSISKDFRHQIDEESSFEYGFHEGNRGVGYTLWKRQDKFVRRIFDARRLEGQGKDKEGYEGVANGQKTLVVVGHSSYFKRFFRRYTKKGNTDLLIERAGFKKMTNCGVVKFNFVLSQKENQGAPYVEEDSMKILYGDLV